MFSRRLLGIGFIVGVGLIVAVAYGVVVLADNSWLTYHWERSSNPVQLTLGDNFKTGAWDGHFTAAVADWNESTVLELTKVAGGTSPRKCKAATGKIEVCAERYGNTGWLGLAQIWISGDHITKAIAKMNDFYFVSGGSYDTPAWRALVMCQEIGHDFGLGRQDGATDSCMGSGQQPNDHDYAQLETIYSQLDEGGGSNEDPPPPLQRGTQEVRRGCACAAIASSLRHGAAEQRTVGQGDRRLARRREDALRPGFRQRLPSLHARHLDSRGRRDARRQTLRAG